MHAAGHPNLSFRQADIFDLPYDDESFDHVFACFVLEHLAAPGEALRSLRQGVRDAAIAADLISGSESGFVDR